MPWCRHVSRDSRSRQLAEMHKRAMALVTAAFTVGQCGSRPARGDVCGCTASLSRREGQQRCCTRCAEPLLRRGPPCSICCPIRVRMRTSTSARPQPEPGVPLKTPDH